MPSATRIIIDERERNSGIPELLRAAGASIEFAQLQVGDYIVSPDTAIERKTVFDLIASIYDGRLYVQCSDLARHYKRPVILIQGNIAELADLPETMDYENLDEKRLKRLAERLPLAYEALAEVALEFRIPIVHAPAPEQAAQMLIAMVNQSLKGGRASGPLLRKIRKENPIRLQQLSVLASVPGVGDKLAGRMLERFRTPHRALNATAPELATIPGFGLARAEKVRRILDSETSASRRGEVQGKLFSEGEISDADAAAPSHG
ncbi:MAG TPA: ERCC4 domain-containing protein [Nitrososphaera sp.]|nr:ERCC4 domain-containing protein [Nitrososphaera sp.]